MGASFDANTGPLSNAVTSAAGGGTTYFSPNGCASSIRSTRKTRTPLLCSQYATRYQPGPARINRYGHTTRVLAAVASPRRYEIRSLRRLASASRTTGKCGLAWVAAAAYGASGVESLGSFAATARIRSRAFSIVAHSSAGR